MENKVQLQPEKVKLKQDPKSIVFDILDKIDLDKSIVHLPMTILDDRINSQDYANYVYDYINCMLVEVMEELDLLESNDFLKLVKEIDAQRAVGDVIRILVILSYQNQDNDETKEVHEMVLKYDDLAKTYTILSYNYNLQSLVVIATDRYLEETLLESDGIVTSTVMQ